MNMKLNPRNGVFSGKAAVIWGVVLATGMLNATLVMADSDGSISKCDHSMGALAVAEPQSQMIASLLQYKLGSPSTMLRMIAQESGCFTVVERGVAMQNLQQERSLMANGMLQEDSNMGGGQMQAADFVMTPAVQFSDDSGGIGATVGGLLGHMGGFLGSIGGLAGGVKFKEADTTLLVADVRSGIQVASAEGKASKMDFSVGGWGWGNMGWASAGGYSKTPEGKLIAASLLDNYNQIVEQIRNRPQLIKSTSHSSRVNATASIQATPLNRQAAPRPQMQSSAAPAPYAGNLPAGLLGNYSGTFSGVDQGTFNVVVASNGVVQGSGYSSKYRAGFIASGLVSATGEMQLSGSGQAGGSTFTGVIDQRTGAVSGQWHMVSNDPSLGGGFIGQRQ